MLKNNVDLTENRDFRDSRVSYLSVTNDSILYYHTDDTLRFDKEITDMGNLVKFCNMGEFRFDDVFDNSDPFCDSDGCMDMPISMRGKCFRCGATLIPWQNNDGDICEKCSIEMNKEPFSRILQTSSFESMVNNTFALGSSNEFNIMDIFNY